jgi:hypothetical protein
MLQPRLVVSIPDASGDGKYYGRYPEGNAPLGLFPNAAPAFLPMRQIYPAPTGTLSNEPHQWAYYKPSTGDSFMWQKRVLVSMGRWPFTYKLMNGPPGMAFGATIWNPLWDGGGNAAYLAGYGVLRWTPNAVVTGQQVWVRVTDQDGNTLDIIWSISTSSDIADPLNPGIFFFLSADFGNDTTGNGSKAAPWLNFQKGWGTSYNSAGATGSAPIGSICVLLESEAMYALPAYSDNSEWSSGLGSNDFFMTNAAKKPNAIIGYPGAQPVIDFSGTTTVPVTGDVTGPAGRIAVDYQSGGFFMQDLVLSGYMGVPPGSGNTSLDAEVRAITFGAQHRLGFQGITWNGAGCGTSSANNASMFWSVGGSPSYGLYLGITGCAENDRQSSGQPNNCAFHQLYNEQEFCIELNSANSPNSDTGECFYLKSDCGYGSLRANFGTFLGCIHGFDCGQSPYNGTNNVDISYNVGVNLLNWVLGLGVGADFTLGSISQIRNSFILTSNGMELAAGLVNGNLTAPYVNGSLPYGDSIPAISTATTGGTIPASTTFYYVVTALGVTGESGTASDQGGTEMTITTGATTNTNTVTVPFLGITGVYDGLDYASGYRVYRGTTSHGENEYVEVAAGSGVLELVDTGNLTWTPGTPPDFGTTSTALSASRIHVTANVIQTPGQRSVPTGATVVNGGGNVFADSDLLDPETGLLLVSNGGSAGAQLT